MKRSVITIARGFGSGGRTIGEMLSRELEIPFYDKELIRLASEDSGIHERLFGAADESIKPKILRKGSNIYRGRVLPPESDAFVSDDNLFNLQAKTIREIAEKGSCVIVGRCADFVLREDKDTVRVFVHAPRQFCIKTVMEFYGLPKQDAEKTIDRTDKVRSAYYKYYTGQEWNDARNYDLCLNSEEMGFQKCVDVIKSYLVIKNR